jgi:hypothetical protein
MSVTKTDSEAAIQAEIPAVIKDLRTIQKRLIVLAERAAALPSYVEGRAANEKSEEVYVETLGLRIEADLRWVAGTDGIEERAVAEAIKRLRDCMATTVEDCERATAENIERHRGEVQQSAARLAKFAEEFTSKFKADLERLVFWARLLPGVEAYKGGDESAERSVDWLQIFCAIQGVQDNDVPMLKEMAEHLRDAAEAKTD